MGKKWSIVNIIQSYLSLSWDFWIQMKNSGSCVFQRLFQRLYFLGAFWEVFIKEIHFSDKVRVISNLLPDFKSLFTLNYNRGISIRKDYHLDNFGQCPYLINILPSRIIIIRIDLRADPNHLIALLGFFNQFD